MKALIALTSIVGFLMVVLPGPLYQYAGVSLGTAFTSLRFGVYVGGAAIILIILQVLLNRKNVNWGSTLVCAILALIAVGMPVSMMSKASGSPHSRYHHRRDKPTRICSYRTTARRRA